jgi:hypothetical protein
MDDCLFCRILDGRDEASFVYRDQYVSAFMDIQSINSGHILIVPNQHAAYLAELDPEIGGRLFQTGQSPAAALRLSPLRCEGVNFFWLTERPPIRKFFTFISMFFPDIAATASIFKSAAITMKNLREPCLIPMRPLSWKP